MRTSNHNQFINGQKFNHVLASLFTLVFSTYVLSASIGQSKGVSIGSTGFFELMDKNIKDGILTTKHDFDGTFVLNDSFQKLHATISSEGVVFSSVIQKINSNDSFRLSLKNCWRADSFNREKGSCFTANKAKTGFL